ncbi:MAG: Crp/Fnr family transcriptional regulator [Pseudomonadota bacterium]
MTRDQIRALLARSTMFEGLDDPVLDRLAEAARFSAAGKGDVLFQQGDASDRMYILAEGTATMSILSEDGREIIVAIAKPGQSFGEIALLDNLSRTATCTMRQAGSYVAIDRAPFLALIDDPKGARRIIAILCAMMRNATGKVEQLALYPLRARVAHALIEQALPGDPPRLKITQNELAQVCSAARPRVNQMLKRLEKEGLIAKEGRVINLIDVEGLREVSEDPLTD